MTTTYATNHKRLENAKLRGLKRRNKMLTQDAIKETIAKIKLAIIMAGASKGFADYHTNLICHSLFKAKWDSTLSAGDNLKQCFNWSKTPQGEGFWKQVEGLIS